MADPSSTFAIKLTDETSGPASNAADALERLKGKIDADVKALADMQRAMRNLKGGTSTSVAAFRELRDKIAAQKASIAAAQSHYVELGGTFGSVARAAKAAAGGGFADLLDTTQGMPGPLGALGARLASIQSLVAGGGAIAAGTLAIVAALVALSAAAVLATGALLRYGIAQSDARRQEALRLEGLTTLRRYHGLVRGSATEMQAAIDRVSGASSLGRGEIEGYASQLHRMGLRGNDAALALQGMATVGAAQGDRWARRFAGMAAGAARTGHSVRALADDVEARLGGLARRHLLGLDVQMRKLREGVERIFSGLRIEGFLSAMFELTQLFSQSTASGRALKTIVEALFNPLLDGIGAAAPLARRIFQGMVIAALQLTIGVLRARNAFVRTFGSSEVLKGINGSRLAILAGGSAVALLTAALLTAAIGAGALAAALGIVAIGVLVLAAPFLLAVAAMAAMFEGGRRLVTWWGSVDWTGLGTSLVDGLVRGLRRGRDAVVSTVRSLASAATETLTDALGIHSPSRVFAELGVQIPRGIAAGVDAGAPSAERAVDGVVPVPRFAPDADAPSGGGAAASTAVSFGDVHLHLAGGNESDGRAAAVAFRDEMRRLLEGVAITMGAPA